MDASQALCWHGYGKQPEELTLRKHKVMLGDKVLYQASQLSHAQRFAKGRQAEGVPCHVVPDETPKAPRKVRINSLTGKPYRKVTSGTVVK